MSDNTLYALNVKYKLYCIINHKGELNSRHYFANINIKNKLYEFNDCRVKKLDNIEKISKTVCILFYIQIKTN